MLLHPYLSPGQQPDLRLVRGEGLIVHDADGREYVDAAGGLWNLALGLGQHEIIEAMYAQAQSMSYCSLFNATHPLAEKLGAKLISLTEGQLECVYLSTTGSSAVEVALRVARTHYRSKKQPNRKAIIGLTEGYHGCSWMNLSASGSMRKEMADWEDPIDNFWLVPGPEDESRSISELTALIERSSTEIAALLIEPILGTGGIIVPSMAYAQKISSLCHEAGILVICDEVATGCGRTGEMFASFALGFDPDMIALAKGLAAGYSPIGATLFAGRVLEPMKIAGAPILFGSTQDGNPTGCAAALATIEIIEREGLMVRAQHMGRAIMESLAPLVGSSVVKEVRGRGLMIGIELCHLEPLGTPFTEEESIEVLRLCREAGLLVYHHSRGISLFPALTISEHEVEDIVEILTSTLLTLA